MYSRFSKFFEEHTNLTRFSLIFREDSSLSFTFCLYKFFLVKLHVLPSSPPPPPPFPTYLQGFLFANMQDIHSLSFPCTCELGGGW